VKLQSLHGQGESASHCVSRRRRTCKEGKGTGEGMVKAAGGSGCHEIVIKENLF
jgi:hypothetical protein